MKYNYNDINPTKVQLEDLPLPQQDLLTKNKTFCIYPWIHVHSFPTGEAFPCCNTEMHASIGNTSQQSLAEIWNGEPMRDLRNKMLSGEPVDGCGRCYEQEANGFFSMRLSANKHFGHHVPRTDDTRQDGSLPDMKIAYWDVRFSNLCNFKCRSCGTIFSSNWYDDQSQLVREEKREEWKSLNKRINVAGRHETDMWEQLSEQIGNLEQVYFAGGEPLIMEEHYRLLHALLDAGRTDVRLIYNTNFSQMTYKKTNVLDLWPHFDNVAVGASLDASGARAEYIRKGTDWQSVEDNRREMQEKCPDVDFYISATLSIMNALHLPDFHQDWTERGLIKAMDFNINILQDPPYYRIDMAKPGYKKLIIDRYHKHLRWLVPKDSLSRASQGFKSAIDFLQADDKTDLLPKFWNMTLRLDKIRNEQVFLAIPELEFLKDE
jgi:organic radical activating enzyme